MRKIFLLALTTTLFLPTTLKSHTNHFSEGGVFELDLGEGEIPLTPKQEREEKLLDEFLKRATEEANE